MTPEQQLRLELLKLLNPSGWGATADLDKMTEQVRRLEQFVIGSAGQAPEPSQDDRSPRSKKPGDPAKARQTPVA